MNVLGDNLLEVPNVRYRQSTHPQSPVRFDPNPVMPEQKRSGPWRMIGGCNEGLSYIVGRAQTLARSTTAQNGAIYLTEKDIAGFICAAIGSVWRTIDLESRLAEFRPDAARVPAILTLELFGYPDKCAVDYDAVIASQFDITRQAAR